MKKKAKVEPFLKKYARLALGAGVAAGAILPAQAQNPSVAADQAPAASKAPSDAKLPQAAKAQVPVSVVYGPPPAKMNLGDIKSGTRVGGIAGVAPPQKKAKSTDAAGGKESSAAQPAPAADAPKKP